jgi:hypothetical protein
MLRPTIDSSLTASGLGHAQSSKAVLVSSSPMRYISTPAILVVLALLVFCIYLPGVGIQYYGDDFGWIDASTAPLRHFVQVNADGWYRPLQASIYTIIQKNFGLNTVPIHLLNFLLHALLCCLIFRSMTELGYTLTPALSAAIFMALSQASAFALLSVDTFSQVAATFFGCVSVWGLLKWNTMRRERTASVKKITPYVVSIVAFALALLSKEAASSFFPILVCATIFRNYDAENKFRFIKKVFAESIPFAAVFFAYLVVHSHIGANSPSSGSGVYNFRIGSNLPINFLLDLFAVTVPISTVTIFEAFDKGETVIVGLAAGASMLLLFAVTYGLWLRRSDLKIAAVVVCLIGAAFPMILLNHVSELYVYNLMPFFSVLVGIGVSAILDAAKRSYLKHAIVACCVLMLVSHIAAIRDKTSLMRKNGERAAMLIQQLGAYIDEVPPRGELLLLNPSTKQTEYAVYLMPGLKVLEFGESFIKKTYAREDITLRIIDESDFKESIDQHKTTAMILGLKGDTLSLIAKPGAKVKNGGEQYAVRNG